MPPDQPADPYDEAFWRDYLTRGDSMERRARRILRLLPHGPRCKLCLAPFGGAAAPLMRAIGKRPAPHSTAASTQQAWPLLNSPHVVPAIFSGQAGAIFARWMAIYVREAVSCGLNA